MFIKPVDDNGNIIDVFCGLGWTEWSRFERHQNNGRISLKLIKGKPMSNENFKLLLQKVK